MLLNISSEHDENNLRFTNAVSKCTYICVTFCGMSTHNVTVIRKHTLILLYCYNYKGIVDEYDVSTA